ncbi:AsmA protein [Elusimicrobium simillimum]|uniref:AsmA-like C-terminal region-containing protein n=1 Tax=Elusimicrobium simillimum TaxID=3143438 RepID=UPI003C6FA679
MKLHIKDINVKINDFKLDGVFNIDAALKVLYSDSDMEVTLPVVGQFAADLKNNNFDTAYAEIKKLALIFNKATFDVTGSVTGFNNPVADIKATISGVNKQTVSGFVADLPNFTLPVIKLAAKVKADLDNSKATVENFSITLPKSLIKGTASANWGGKDIAYTANTNISLALAEIAAIAQELTAPYNLTGGVTGDIVTTEKNPVKGSIKLSNINASYEDIATVKEITGDITISSLSAVKTSDITGKINDANFKTNLSLTEAKANHYKVDFNFDLDSLTLKKLPASSADTTASATPAASGSAAAQPSGSNMLFDVKSNIKVGKITVPHFYSDGVTLQTNLTNVDADLKKITGPMSFDLQKGAISDINAFLKSNKLVNVMFISLGVVDKVFKYLKLDVFNKSGQAKDEIPFHSIEGAYTFKSGLMNIDKTTLNSDLATVQALGTIDFNTEKLNMKVNAHLGKQGSSGFKPVAIKVGGTMSDPKPTLDVLSTATSIIPGLTTLGKNTATGTASTAKDVASGTATAAKDAAAATVNTAKDALKGIGGLFKKDSSSSASSESK